MLRYNMLCYSCYSMLCTSHCKEKISCLCVRIVDFLFLYLLFCRLLPLCLTFLPELVSRELHLGVNASHHLDHRRLLARGGHDIRQFRCKQNIIPAKNGTRVPRAYRVSVWERALRLQLAQQWHGLCHCLCHCGTVCATVPRLCVEGVWATAQLQLD